jgi:thioredoxin 1
MLEITDKTFDETIENTSNLIIKFEADWCAPCKILTPIMEDLSKEYKEEVKIFKCDVDKNPELCEKFHIRSIPSVFFFKNGKIFDTKIGVGNKATFAKKIELLLM